MRYKNDIERKGTQREGEREREKVFKTSRPKRKKRSRTNQRTYRQAHHLKTLTYLNYLVAPLDPLLSGSGALVDRLHEDAEAALVTSGQPRQKNKQPRSIMLLQVCQGGPKKQT